MILALDIGNTHIVMGCIEDKEIKNIARMTSDTLKTEHEYAVLIKEILDIDGIDISNIEGAIISSVVPPLNSTVRGAIRRVTGHKPMLVGAGIKTGLNIMIDTPAQLGSDLAVAGVAALAAYKPPIIIVDMGTATTMTVIGENSALLGGPIMPGVALSVSALASHTSQLLNVSIDAPKNCIGKNTIDSMKSGAVFGAASMIDGMIERIEEELGSMATVVATGGLAGRIIPYCRRKDIICDDDLLLKGLEIIYYKNAKK
jgi:type III pantothenate kinase